MGEFSVSVFINRSLFNKAFHHVATSGPSYPHKKENII